MVVRQKQVLLRRAEPPTRKPRLWPGSAETLSPRLPAVRARNTKSEALFEVRCPHCKATREFLTPDGRIMLRVLEDEQDTELLEEGRVLYCEACGEPFRCPRNPVAA